MILVCINNISVSNDTEHVKLPLTIGKQYMLASNLRSFLDNNFYIVLDDLGGVFPYSMDNFTTVEKYRELKLKELGI